MTTISIGRCGDYNYLDNFLNNPEYAEEKDEVTSLIDVAFNDNIFKTEKVSYCKTIDVQFGRYQKKGSRFNGCLTVNFKPTHGFRDWLINLFCFGIKYHFGYKHEIYRYMTHFINDLLDQIQQDEPPEILIAGRSKGAGEALMLCEAIYTVMRISGMKRRLIVGAFAPPKCMSKTAGKERADAVGMANIYTFVHRSDIVPKMLPWFSHVPCYMIEFGKKGENPFRTHVKVTTDRSVYDEIFNK